MQRTRNIRSRKPLKVNTLGQVTLKNNKQTGIIREMRWEEQILLSGSVVYALINYVFYTNPDGPPDITELIVLDDYDEFSKLTGLQAAIKQDIDMNNGENIPIKMTEREGLTLHE